MALKETTEKALSGVTYRLFLGFRATIAVSTALKASALWHADSDSGSAPIITAHHDDKEYIGMAMSSSSPTIIEIREAETSLRDIIQGYCPTLRIDNIPLTLFPQTLIS
ncbi:MAG: hypothetical protein HN411_02610 [Waddliaceae bacterium]|jgi:hypothetical protein|nr:hypothetical protein [Waddliaceae bacterium]MBT3578695.1 hypothetical protein [Waddliaceae bacterium]MBT4445414.1 hypothetical protein [Waddliaceae bacterium]MBT6928318.1 hypothetical protein [Waddliaceae bacterium]MBT7265004.1 hypothetical protein [Waddliaceae bacterium]